MLVDNGSAVDILYLNTYNRMGLSDLRPVMTPLYGFIGDSLMPRGNISLPVTTGEHPRVSIVIANFLVVDCPSAYNAIIGQPTLKVLKAITSIYHLTMKFL